MDPRTRIKMWHCRWILAVDEYDEDIEIESLETPGEPDTHCSNRSKLSGMLCSILRNHQWSKHNHTSEGLIAYGCDGEAAIGITNNVFEVTKSDRKHFDVFSRMLMTQLE